jgi:23S rRNA (guanosine2251-2'-O)-methyltransferase
MDTKTAYIYGRNAIIEALNSEDSLPEKVFVMFGATGEPIDNIYTLAKKKGVPIVKHDKRKFSELEKKAGVAQFKSQGVIALKQLIRFFELEEFINQAYSKSDSPVIVALDEISDPHNLGAIARSAECSGAAGIIIQSSGASPVTPTALKTSAGALEHLPVCRVPNMAQTLKMLKMEGFKVIGTAAGSQNQYTDDLYRDPIILIIGSEGTGMQTNVAKTCDYKVSIPLKGKIESLNASVSAAIMLYEVLRQRNSY